IVLLLNRRGYSTFALCRDCGHVEECPNCDISLTYHKGAHQLKCHYCNHEQAMPATCPACESHLIRFFVTGTARVQAERTKVLLQARIIRVDVYTLNGKDGNDKL